MSLVLGLCLTLDTCCLLSPPFLCSWDCVLHWILVVYSTHHVFVPVTMFYTGYMLHDASSMSLFLGLYLTLESCFILPPACLCSWDCVAHLKHVASCPHHVFVPKPCVLHWMHVVSCTIMSLFLGLFLKLDTCCIVPHNVFVPGTVFYTEYMLFTPPTMSLFL